MIFIDIPEAKKTLYMPEALDECDNRQYNDIAKLLYWFHCGDINLFEFKQNAVPILLGLKPLKRTYKSENDIPDEDLAKYENVFRLSEFLDNFFEEEENEGGQKLLRVKQYFTKNFLPTYKLFRKYIGPEDGFTDVTFGQYLDGLEEFIYFSNSGDLQSLRTLFAIFYLRKGETYSYKLAKKRAESWFKYVDIRHLYGFYMFFSAMQLYFQSGQIEVMGNPIDLSIIYQEIEPGKKSNIQGIGMHSVLNDLAESGVFGAADSVRNTNLWTVLLRLYELKKKQIDELSTNSTNNES